MPSILVAIDGSEQSLRALNKVIDGSALYKAPPEIHLATIHLPVPYAGRVSHAIGRDSLEQYYREEEAQTLQPARDVLDRAGLKYSVHTAVGEPAEQINRIAEAHHCDQIVMGTHGRGRVGAMILGSVAQKLVHLAKIPVTLVP